MFRRSTPRTLVSIYGMILARVQRENEARQSRVEPLCDPGQSHEHG
jgi:hypothetical protein